MICPYRLCGLFGLFLLALKFQPGIHQTFPGYYTYTDRSGCSLPFISSVPVPSNLPWLIRIRKKSIINLVSLNRPFKLKNCKKPSYAVTIQKLLTIRSGKVKDAFQAVQFSTTNGKKFCRNFFPFDHSCNMEG